MVRDVLIKREQGEEPRYQTVVNVSTLMFTTHQNHRRPGSDKNTVIYRSCSLLGWLPVQVRAPFLEGFFFSPGHIWTKDHIPVPPFHLGGSRRLHGRRLHAVTSSDAASEAKQHQPPFYSRGVFTRAGETQRRCRRRRKKDFLTPPPVNQLTVFCRQ